MITKILVEVVWFGFVLLTFVLYLTQEARMTRMTCFESEEWDRRIGVIGVGGPIPRL